MSGLSVHKRHTLLSCGKIYHGKKNLVDKLTLMHLKLCTLCNKNKDSVFRDVIHTNRQLTNNIDDLLKTL